MSNLYSSGRISLKARTDRPISTFFNVYWTAIFENEYDGAPDSRSLIGWGKTEQAAIDDLLEQDAEESGTHD